MSHLDCPIQVGNTLTTELTVRNCKTNAIIDVSSATGTKEIVLLGPTAGTRYVVDATFVTDGVDGKITATFTPGQINVAGDWKVQGFVILTSGTFKTSIRDFEVEENI